MSHCPAAPSPAVLQSCALIAVKVTEQYPLTEEERDRLEPAIKSWDLSTLHNFMCWEKDKLGIFGTDPVFFEYRLAEDGANIGLSPLFYSPDPQTTYAVVTNGSDSGVVMTLSHEKWSIVACVGVYKIMDRLAEQGFLPWAEFQARALAPGPAGAPAGAPAEAHSPTRESDDDYWDQYDQEPEEEPEEPSQPSKKTNTRAFIKSHCMRTVKDIYMLYSAQGISTQQYATDLLASVAPLYRQCVSSGTPLAQYLERAIHNELQLYEQVDLDLQVFLADIEVALLDLDFQVLSKLG